MSQPYRRQTQNQMKSDVAQGGDDLAVSRHFKRFQTKSGKCGKTAQQTDKNKSPGFRTKYLPTFDQSPAEPDQQTAGDIDNQGPVGERGGTCQTGHQTGQQVAADGTGKSAASDN